MTDSPQRPQDNDPVKWKHYWTAEGTPWRTEPEINEARQRYLAERREVAPDIEEGIYPFREKNGAIKLTRADVEWLLATHEHEGTRGPIDPSDEHLPYLRGPDLRGADLRATNLSNLPFTRLQGGNAPHELAYMPGYLQDDAIVAAAIHLEGANLRGAHLEGALLIGAYLEGAHLEGAHLEGAYLYEASLSGAVIMQAHMEGVTLDGARLEGVFAVGVHLEGAATTLREAHLERARMEFAHLEGALLANAHLEGATLREAHLEGADLKKAHLEGTALNGADLGGKHIEDADLSRIRKWRPNFLASQPAADLRKATFDAKTNLMAARLGDESLGSVRLADVLYNGVNLAVVDWRQVTKLGDDQEAEQLDKEVPPMTQPGIRVYIRQEAVRANRQLAVALRGQGLNEEADRFAYNAQRLQTKVVREQGKRPEWLFREGLDKLAGFGYRWERTLYWYGAVAFLSTLVYFWQNLVFVPHAAWYQALGEAFVAAITALHGRGFFPEAAQSGWQMGMAVFDAVAGLVIEASFVATFVQRFFAR